MQTEMSPPDKIYFRNLDSIRFFAALMVFMQHGMFASYKYLNIHGTILERFLYGISNGGTGVSIFFVLSGFLITYLILSEIELRGRFSLKKFYIRRILRIWPLYFAVVTIAFFIFPELSRLLKSPINQGANLFYQLTFLSNFDIMQIEKYRTGTEIMMQNITWSVAIEEQFYAFWPLIFFFLPRKFFLPAICLVILGSLIFIAYNLNDPVILYFHTLSAMLYLGTGALYAYFIISSTKIKSFFQRIPIATILSSFILFFFSIMYADVIFSSKAGEFISHLYFAVLFGFIIASQSMISQTSLLGLGNLRIPCKLGAYTYGMYLLHPVALEVVHIIAKKAHAPTNSFFPLFIIGVSGFALTLFISWASYNYFEKRFLNLKKMFEFITKD